MNTMPLRPQEPPPRRPPPVTDAPWRLSWLLAAPHRLGFFGAALVLATSALWWGVMLLLRHLGVALPWAVPAPPAHALLMSQGFMPLFITGFLFTAGPKWLGQPEVHARQLLAPVAAMLAGWLLALAGFHLHAALAASGVALAAAGWSVLVAHFARILRRSRVPDRVHATVVTLACAVGALALWLSALALLLAQTTWLRAGTQIALWGFLAPVFVTVSHRMIPFFTASALPLLDAWRPMWLLWTLLAALWLELPPALAELWWWPLPDTLRAAQAVLDAAASALLLWLALRWGLVQSLKIRLLAMLHGGFFWLGIAFGLSAASHALQAVSHGELSLGLAPLHALTMGYLGATLFAMATRVSSGHGGRPLAADNLAWGLYWIAQGAALLRVLAALWPSGPAALTLLAAGAWAIACVGWALRYGGWYGRPRIDGRPG